MGAEKKGNSPRIDDEKMQRIIGRAVLDTTFRKALLDPETRDAALAEYKLSDLEVEHLGHIKLTKEIADIFDKRVSPVLACIC